MNLKDSINVAPIKPGKLHGRARLDLMRNGEVVKRIEHDNAITPAINDFLNGSIGTGYLSSGFGKAYSTKDFFGGCFLLDDTVDYTDTPPTELPSGLNITAHAGQDAYVGDNLTRGNFNSVESGWTSNGYRFVWDWNTAQGNGTIASICLTHKANGYNGFYHSENTNEPAMLLSNGSRIPYYCTVYGAITLMDSANNLYYVLKRNNNSFTLEKYRASISKLVLMENQLIGTYQLSTTLSFVAKNTSAWLLDNKLYIIYGSGVYVKIAIVDLNNLSSEVTCTDMDLTLAGVNITPNGMYGNKMLAGMYPMSKENGKTYMYVPLNNGVAKFDINNVADVTVLDNPNSISNYAGYYTPIGTNKNMFYSSSNGLLIKDNAIYEICKKAFDVSYSIEAKNNNYGILAEAGDYQGNGPYARSLLSPALITTVNNLDNAVTKTADVTMKLTYTITEE